MQFLIGKASANESRDLYAGCVILPVKEERLGAARLRIYIGSDPNIPKPVRESIFWNAAVTTRRSCFIKSFPRNDGFQLRRGGLLRSDPLRTAKGGNSAHADLACTPFLFLHPGEYVRPSCFRTRGSSGIRFGTTNPW